ncbi:MAG TPA: thermonuclease family protein [Thermoguttaceae bacterium]|nr:thermonuclease family protein [Thermoguttaceae bacterium]
MARRYRRPFRPNSPLGVVVLLILVAVGAWRVWQDRNEPQSPPALVEGPYEIQRVVDGDTLVLSNRAKIRLIGADTPETVKPNHPVEPWGPEASAFTKRFVAGKQVRLQMDREQKDQYGRFLAYVWVDGRMLNEELIREGYARAITRYPYSSSMKTRFRRAETEARAARRGIWSAD